MPAPLAHLLVELSAWAIKVHLARGAGASGMEYTAGSGASIASSISTKKSAIVWPWICGEDGIGCQIHLTQLHTATSVLTLQRSARFSSRAGS